MNLRHELVKNFGQLRFAARLGFLQCLQNNPQMTRPRPGGDVVAHFLVERHQPNTVCLPQQQVRQTSRELGGIPGFTDPRSGVPHGAADIDEQGRTQIGFFLVFLDVEPVGLAVHLPIEPPNLVPLHVLAVLAELDTESLVRRRVQSGTNPFDDKARQDLQIGNLLQIGWSQKISRSSHDWAESKLCWNWEGPRPRGPQPFSAPTEVEENNG